MTSHGTFSGTWMMSRWRPVRPPRSYRLQKFTRRHQTAVLATAAVGLALILGAGVAAGQAYRATKAEKLAEEQLQIATEQQRLAKEQAQLAQKQKRLAEEAAEREAKLRVDAEQATQQAEAARKQAEAVTEYLVEALSQPRSRQETAARSRWPRSWTARHGTLTPSSPTNLHYGAVVTGPWANLLWAGVGRHGDSLAGTLS